FLSSLTAVMSNLIYFAGPALWWLYLIFPSDYALQQAGEDFSFNATQVKFARLAGLSPATQAIFCFVLAVCGLRGVFNFSKPCRMLLLVGSIALSLFSGFRSGLIIFMVLLAVQFFVEGMFRTRYMISFVLAGILGFALLVPFANKLPLSVQRSISFLPFDVD